MELVMQQKIPLIIQNVLGEHTTEQGQTSG